jgi:hypothetical protein
VLVSVTVRLVIVVPKLSDEGSTHKANTLDTKSVLIIIKKNIILNNFVFILYFPRSVEYLAFLPSSPSPYSSPLKGEELVAFG